MVLVVLLLCHCWFVLVAIALISGGAQGGNVTYDHRSLIINGQHKILFSGSIHYPRSTPQMWPSLIAKAKAGGLDVIQTYVFWSLHEPQLGQFDFSGRNDLVGFIKEIQAQGLYACLRIGPFIEGEWGYGGLPFWLHEVPGIVFRSDNKPYKLHMKRFVTRIVKMMKSERLFASQGGPVVLSQIENEYGKMEKLYQTSGSRYVHWAAKMAVGLQTGVPWVMCKQDDAPDPVINSCNGRRCGETFKGPNSPNKPAIWTENWTSFFQTYGQGEQIRSAEDIAYNVALFIAKKGSYVNYYMYHGGTNFGRVASSYVVTSYYDQAPLDEYGLHRQPKWGHLKELHAAIKLSMEPLLSGKQHTVTFGHLQQGSVFKSTSGGCAAFLVNSDTTKKAIVNFRNTSHKLPPRSVSILPDCKVVVFNSAKVTAQHSTRSMEPSQKLDSAEKWGEYREAVPKFDETSTRANTLLEHMNMTKDSSDYLWYTFSFRQDSPDSQSLLSVRSKGHVLHAFVNGVLIGSVHGQYRHKIPQFKNAVQLNAGTNYVSLLSVMVGLPDAGSYLESRSAGLYKVKIENTNGSRDFANHQWGYQVGLFGERSKVYTDNGSKSVQWNSYGSSNDHQPLTWYKTSFDAPPGKDPVALNLGSMGKGEAWVNGHSIGRYWVSFQTYKGTPSQTWYNVPRSFLNSTGNLLVLLEEQKGNPLGISVDVVSTSKVCGHVPDSYPPPVNAWRGLRHHGRRPKVRLRCPFGKIISKILFASYGTPSGDCRKYAIGSCHSSHSTSVMEKDCVGKGRCSVPVSATTFGGDPCSGHPKSLLVDAQCS